MNLSPRWEAAFREAGIEATHWSGVGRRDAPDVEIMTYASANDYVVLTHDLDFGAILAANQSEKPSVVQIRTENVNPDIAARHVIAALRQLTPELERGALVTVDPNRGRVRLLPLLPRT
jgi:predicted nuclease of predicted toxin-antitoxin system